MGGQGIQQNRLAYSLTCARLLYCYAFPFMRLTRRNAVSIGSKLLTQFMLY